MNREISNKLNLILYLRSQNRINNKRISEEQNSFDAYFKDHIVRSHQTRNIRGLFRVPDISSGEHLKINTVESDAEEEQTMQLPQRNDVLSF